MYRKKEEPRLHTVEVPPPLSKKGFRINIIYQLQSKAPITVPTTTPATTPAATPE